MGPTLHSSSRCDWLSLYNLLARMNPRERIRWLQACCTLASRGSDPVRVNASRGELDEAWWDWRSIEGQGELNVDRAGSLASRILAAR